MIQPETADLNYWTRKYGAGLFDPMLGVRKPAKPKVKKKKGGKK